MIKPLEMAIEKKKLRIKDPNCLKHSVSEQKSTVKD